MKKGSAVELILAKKKYVTQYLKMHRNIGRARRYVAARALLVKETFSIDTEKYGMMMQNNMIM